MPTPVSSVSSRRVGLNKRYSPAPLLKSIRGRETNQPLPITVSKLKLPEAIDDPPASSDDESDGAGSGNPSGETGSRENQPSVDSKSFLEPPPFDSSDDSEYDTGRTALGAIKRTKFGSNRGGFGLKASKSQAGSGTRSSSNKRRKLSNDDGTSDPSSSLGKKDSFSEPASSGAHLQDDFGFVKQTKKAKTYSRQKAQPKKALRDASSPKPKMQIPDDLDSPQKGRATRNSIRIPTGSDFSPLKDSPAKLKKDWDSEDNLLDSPAKPVAFKDPEPVELTPTITGKTKRGRAGRRPLARMEVNRSPSPTRAIFKMPDDFSQPHIESGRENGSATVTFSDLDSSGDEAVMSPAEPSAEETNTPEVLCPWCGDPVDGAFLRDFSKGKRLNVRMQTRFCQKHKKATAMENWKARRYPEVQWDELESRFSDHDGLLLDIVNGAPSYFGTILADKIKSGKARSLKKEDNMNPGYYGPRGFNLMCDYLVDKFGDLLKKRAVDDRVISGRGSAAFIQSVLVAELAVQLIMVDMDVAVEEARDIMEESKALGEMVHEEL